MIVGRQNAAHPVCNCQYLLQGFELQVMVQPFGWLIAHQIRSIEYDTPMRLLGSLNSSNA
jgi:hypothetical protein